mmetsp:Transcript_7996/g.19207  ORF Transcript_7996/g.19207 Transcript_7996/m.19207 type:complete len:690 (+) Transcript_7996:139-2208(+)
MMTLRSLTLVKVSWVVGPMWGRSFVVRREEPDEPIKHLLRSTRGELADQPRALHARDIPDSRVTMNPVSIRKGHSHSGKQSYSQQRHRTPARTRTGAASATSASVRSIEVEKVKDKVSSSKSNSLMQQMQLRRSSSRNQRHGEGKSRTRRAHSPSSSRHQSAPATASASSKSRRRRATITTGDPEKGGEKRELTVEAADARIREADLDEQGRGSPPSSSSSTSSSRRRARPTKSTKNQAETSHETAHKIASVEEKPASAGEESQSRSHPRAHTTAMKHSRLQPAENGGENTDADHALAPTLPPRLSPTSARTPTRRAGGDADLEKGIVRKPRVANQMKSSSSSSLSEFSASSRNRKANNEHHHQPAPLEQYPMDGVTEANVEYGKTNQGSVCAMQDGSVVPSDDVVEHDPSTTYDVFDAYSQDNDLAIRDCYAACWQRELCVAMELIWHDGMGAGHMECMLQLADVTTGAAILPQYFTNGAYGDEWRICAALPEPTHEYHCTHGTPSGALSRFENTENCVSCESGRALDFVGSNVRGDLFTCSPVNDEGVLLMSVIACVLLAALVLLAVFLVFECRSRFAGTGGKGDVAAGGDTTGAGGEKADAGGGDGAKADPATSEAVKAAQCGLSADADPMITLDVPGRTPAPPVAAPADAGAPAAPADAGVAAAPADAGEAAAPADAPADAPAAA